MKTPSKKSLPEKDFEFLRPELSGKPEYMEIYLCQHCGFDSGFADTQIHKRCFFCDKSDGLDLLHKEEISMEVIVKRMAYSARRMNNALRWAYNLVDHKKSFLEIWNSPDLLVPDEDEEKKMLDLMALGKNLEDNMTSIFSKKKKLLAKTKQKTKK